MACLGYGSFFHLYGLLGAWALWDDLIGNLRPEELAAHATSIPPIPEGYILTSTLENVQARRRHALDLVLVPPFGLFALGCAGLCVLHVVSSPKVFSQAPHLSLYWLVYRHNNQISVVIESGASLIHARMRASLDELDEGEFTEGHGKSVARVPTLGQVDDLMLVDTEDHLLLTRQLDDEFQLLAGWMHQLDSHIALDLGNFCAAAQEFEAQHVERSR